MSGGGSHFQHDPRVRVINNLTRPSVIRGHKHDSLNQNRTIIREDVFKNLK